MNWRAYVNKVRKGAIEPTPMTKTKKRAYLKQLGTVCPYCGSSDSLMRVQGEPWGHEPERVSVRVDCAECKHHWIDVYSLTDMVEAVP